MSMNDSEFRDLARGFINGIHARKPSAATPEESLFLDYLRKNEDRLFEQTSETSGIQNTG
jgi:hypothetical protein